MSVFEFSATLEIPELGNEEIDLACTAEWDEYYPGDHHCPPSGGGMMIYSATLPNGKELPYHLFERHLTELRDWAEERYFRSTPTKADLQYYGDKRI